MGQNIGRLIEAAANYSPLFLLLLGYLAGRWAENSHFRSIREREELFAHIPVTTAKTFAQDKPVAESRLCVGSVVVSIDYYKRFLAHLRNIFGGEVGAYSPLIDRGRREAVLRMKAEYPEADMFVNLRLETATLFNGRQKSTGSVEMLCYATAVKFAK
ncbi:MAG: heavy metal-binding domain-containing protein [Elusimicrobiota bacterium]